MYKFKVILYADKGELESPQSGFVYGNSFSEAMRNIIEYYGDTETYSVQLEFMADSNIILANEELCSLIKKENEGMM